MTEQGERERGAISHLRRARWAQHKLIAHSLGKFFEPVCTEALPDEFVELLVKLDARSN